MKILPWFPPALTPCGISILDLPPDDFELQSKLDGARALVHDGQVFTRHGTLLSKAKGSERCLAACSTLPRHITLEGEWCSHESFLWCFNLPDHEGTHDERIEDLICLISHLGPRDGTNVGLIHRCIDCSFREFYDGWKASGVAEGVVAKRRSGLYRKMARPGMKSSDLFKRRFKRFEVDNRDHTRGR